VRGKKVNVKAIKYQTKICDSVLDSVHGFFYNINEIYVPKLKIAFNEKGGLFKINKDNESRISPNNIFNVKNIIVKKADMEVLIDFLENKANCSSIVKDYFPVVENLM